MVGLGPGEPQSPQRVCCATESERSPKTQLGALFWAEGPGRPLCLAGGSQSSGIRPSLCIGAEAVMRLCGESDHLLEMSENFESLEILEIRSVKSPLS